MTKAIAHAKHHLRVPEKAELVSEHLARGGHLEHLSHGRCRHTLCSSSQEETSGTMIVASKPSRSSAARWPGSPVAASMKIGSGRGSAISAARVVPGVGAQLASSTAGGGPSRCSVTAARTSSVLVSSQT